LAQHCPLPQDPQVVPDAPVQVGRIVVVVVQGTLRAVAELETVVGRPRVAVRVLLRIGGIVWIVAVVRIDVDEAASAMVSMPERRTANAAVPEAARPGVSAGEVAASSDARTASCHAGAGDSATQGKRDESHRGVCDPPAAAMSLRAMSHDPRHDS